MPYDPVADFAPIIRLTDAFMALAVHPSVPATTAQEFVAYLKARPGQVNYASPGRGTPHHLSMELFKLATGTDVKHVPYRGSAPAVQDLVGGHVSAMFIPVHVGLPLAKDNQIRILAVANNSRVSVAPDVPTLPEQGITGVDVDFWLGMLAPAGTRARDGCALQRRPQRDPARAGDRPEAVGAGLHRRRRHGERLRRPNRARSRQVAQGGEGRRDRAGVIADE